MKPDCKEIERQLAESRREFRAADATINNLELKLADMAAQLANDEKKCRELEAKISAMSEDQKKAIESIKQADAAVKLAHEKFSALAAENAALKESEREFDKMCTEEFGPDWVSELTETPATDAFLAEVRTQGVEMFAQWCRGERDFTLIDENVPDADAYEECVKRAEYFAAQLRKGGNQ